MKDTPAEQPSIEEVVNSLTDSMTKDDNGSWALPEDTEVSPELAYAAMAERRRRDTQADYTRSRQDLKVLKTENEQLLTEWEKDAMSKLSKEQQEDLDALKHEDPDAWRTKLNEYEQANRESFGNRTKEIKEKAVNETELEKRTRLLEEHNAAYPDFQLTDDVIDNDLPPRLTKQLASGEITFEQFLATSAEYLGKPKVLDKGTKAPDEPNLGKAPGGSKPTDLAVEADVRESYKDETY